jgi:hypothetical protein
MKMLDNACHDLLEAGTGCLSVAGQYDLRNGVFVDVLHAVSNLCPV